jgi:hypothetical protein
VVPRTSGPVFMFCTPGLIFGGTEGVSSRFHVFSFPDSFSAVRWVPGLVFKFCAPGLIFGGTEGIRSHIHVLRARTCVRRCRGRRVMFSCLPSWTRFRRYRGCRVPFSCFVLSDLCSAVLRASGPVFKFCAPELIFSGTEGVRTRIHVLRSWICVRRCRVLRVPFSCFVRPDSFSAVPFSYFARRD